MDEKLAALPLLPPPTDLQRVEMEREQRVAPPLAAPPATAPNPPPADITASHPAQLEHNKRRRSPGYYRPLTAAELNRLPNDVFRKIGQKNRPAI